MAKFYFDESVANNVLIGLNNTGNNIQNIRKNLNKAIIQLEMCDGFDIVSCMNAVDSEIKIMRKISGDIKIGENTIRQALAIVQKYERLAENTNDIINPDDNTVQDTSDTDNNVESEFVPDTSPNVESVLDQYPEGAYIQGDKIYIPNGRNIKIVDMETGGEKYMVLIPLTDNYFEKGSYHGYVQITSNGGWFESPKQCVATAFATTDMYNGVKSTPYDRYSAADYEKGEIGGATGASWYSGMTAQAFLEFCTQRLDEGYATTIYSHKKAYNFEEGHALTVVGYVPTGPEPSIFDLIVVDPWNGGQFRLGDTPYVSREDNAYINWFTIDSKATSVWG